MNTQFTRKNALLAFGALTLLGAPLAAAPVQAQTGGAADNGKPISLNLINVPIQTALRTLFSSAGIRNYTIDPGVQGYANITVSDVPFSVALNQLLGSGNPPLEFSVVGGIYNIKVKTAAPPPAVNLAATDPNNPPAQVADQPKRFYLIPINSYDAYYIATLVGQAGIVEVVPNYPAGGQGGNQGGAQGGTGQGNRGGFGSSNVSSVGGGGFGGGSGMGGFGGGSGGYGGSSGGFGGGGFGGGFGR